MESLPIDLFKYLKINFPEIHLNQIKNWLKCVAKALEYSHSKGVVHLDVKPENVGIINETEAVLMDFGLS
jgi:casein kinase II subunit alpha